MWYVGLTEPHTHDGRLGLEAHILFPSHNEISLDGTCAGAVSHARKTSQDTRFKNLTRLLN